MWTWIRIQKLWKFILIILTPIVLLPVAFADGESNKFKCAYTILLIAIFWMLELLPLPVTSLVPVILFPFLGIQSTGSVVANYMRETAMMFIGGVSLALAIQYSGLHKRIALKTMLTIGSSPWRLLLGILVTSFLLSSIVVINTAVTAMMVPIIFGVVESLDERESIEKRKSLKKLYYIAVGYAANIGGTATMISSQPNLIFKELIQQENIGQDGKYTDLNFVTFIAYALPIAVINLFFTWLILGWIFIVRPKFHSNKQSSRHSSPTPTVAVISEDIRSQDTLSKNQSDQVAKQLRRKLNELGTISFHEWSVIVLIAVAAILWLFRDPHVFPGWISIFPVSYPTIGDSTVAIAVLIIMFIVPKEISYFRGESSGKVDTVLSWEYIQQHFPWHVIFIVGGGLAISDGANASGLSAWFGDQLQGLENLSRHVILVVIVILTSLVTELLSNAAAVSLLTPILIALSKKLHMHPLFLSLPGAIACQYSFMLPSANPANSIVFAAGDMKIMDMVKPGFFLNFSCVTILYLMNISWGEYVIFNYNNYEYANTTLQAP